MKKHLLLLLSFVLMSFKGYYSQTQLIEIGIPTTMVAGEMYNIYVSLYAVETDNIQGIAFKLPSEVNLLRVTSAQIGAKCNYAQTNFLSRDVDGHYIAFVDTKIKDKETFCISVKVKDKIPLSLEKKFIAGLISAGAYSRVLFEPKSTYMEDITSDKYVKPISIIPQPETNTFCLKVDTAAHPKLLLPTKTSNGLSFKKDFSVSMVLKTTQSSGVLFSTWTGNIQDDYPVELEIDADGHLKLYCGNIYAYHGVVSQKFVATGNWTNVIVSYSANKKLLKLFIDNVFQDSIDTKTMDIDNTISRPVAIFSRAGKEKYVQGYLKALLVSTDNSVYQLQNPSTLAQNINTSFFENYESTTKSFEGTMGATIQKIYYVKDEENFSVQATIQPEGILLEWTSTNTAKTIIGFGIEKSLNGKEFFQIGMTPIADGATAYTYKEANSKATQTIAFYRVAILKENSDKVYSQLVKVGIASSKSIETFQNIPNPFSVQTLIRYQLNYEMTVEFVIYSAIGKEMARISFGTQQPGLYQKIINADEFNLTNGLYFYKIITPYGSSSHKMILAR